MAIHTYHINLDERGEFHADVRRRGNTVFFLNGPDVFVDGFMKHKNDTAGLQEYLYGFGVFDHNDSIGTEAEADAEANSNVLRAASNGQMLLPDGTPLFHRYPEGDYDDIKAHEPNLSHLYKALFDARECGEVPNVSVFILPNGEEFNIDHFNDTPVRDDLGALGVE